MLVLGAKPMLYGGQTSLPNVRRNLAESLTKFIDELENASRTVPVKVVRY